MSNRQIQYSETLFELTQRHWYEDVNMQQKTANVYRHLLNNTKLNLQETANKKSTSSETVDLRKIQIVEK